VPVRNPSPRFKGWGDGGQVFGDIVDRLALT
jgi:hypothetical protein